MDKVKMNRQFLYVISAIIFFNGGVLGLPAAFSDWKLDVTAKNPMMVLGEPLELEYTLTNTGERRQGDVTHAQNWRYYVSLDGVDFYAVERNFHLSIPTEDHRLIRMPRTLAPGQSVTFYRYFLLVSNNPFNIDDEVSKLLLFPSPGKYYFRVAYNHKDEEMVSETVEVTVVAPEGVNEESLELYLYPGVLFEVQQNDDQDIDLGKSSVNEIVEIWNDYREALQNYFDRDLRNGRLEEYRSIHKEITKLLEIVDADETRRRIERLKEEYPTTLYAEILRKIPVLEKEWPKAPEYIDDNNLEERDRRGLEPIAPPDPDDDHNKAMWEFEKLCDRLEDEGYDPRGLREVAPATWEEYHRIEEALWAKYLNQELKAGEFYRQRGAALERITRENTEPIPQEELRERIRRRTEEREKMVRETQERFNRWKEENPEEYEEMLRRMDEEARRHRQPNNGNNR